MRNDSQLWSSIGLAATAVGVLWSVKLFEFVTGASFHDLGIYPRDPAGAIGILTAPLIHGSWQHLISNTLPMLLLGSVLHYGYPRTRYTALTLIWFLSGCGVWLFARESFHFGASGLTHGMFFFLFTMGILRRDKRSVAILMLAFFMYGTMLLTIFPREPGISYEYHFFGALGGVLGALLFRRGDPVPERKVYSWEGDEAEDEDSIIGDEWMRDEDVERNEPH